MRQLLQERLLCKETAAAAAATITDVDSAKATHPNNSHNQYAVEVFGLRKVFPARRKTLTAVLRDALSVLMTPCLSVCPGSAAWRRKARRQARRRAAAGEFVAVQGSWCVIRVTVSVLYTSYVLHDICYIVLHWTCCLLCCIV